MASTPIGPHGQVISAATLKLDTAYMEVPRCDGCRFWARVGFVSDLGACTRENAANAKLYVSGVAGSVLMTDEAFGCVQFEAK